MPVFEQLYRETDFIKFCHLLRKFAKLYTVIIVASDTPCGSPNFTFEVAKELMNIGLKIPLHDKYNCSYSAVINKGQLVFENISPDNAVMADFEFNGHKIEVCSRNCNLRTPMRFWETFSWIKINETKWPCHSGLTFVIWDSVCNELLYLTRFDTVEALKKRGDGYGYNWSAIYIKEKYPNRRLITVNAINFPYEDTEDKSDNEILSLYKMNRIVKLLSYENLDTIIGYSYYKFFQENSMLSWFAMNEYIDSPEEMLEIITPPKSYIATDGARRADNYCGKYLNIMSGHRLTLGNPDKASRTIWFIGNCTTYGVGARDEGTIQSRLQSMLNDNVEELSFSVQNYGYLLWNTDIFAEMIAVYESLPINDNDIVVVQIPANFKADIDLSEIGKRPHNYGELFWDACHHTENAYRLIAEKIFEYLKKNNFYIDDIAQHKTAKVKYDVIKRDYGLSQYQQEQLEAYKQNLRNFYDNTFAAAVIPPKVGAIVMNCNPFTLGHRYLIEKAAKKVDFLIVFIVQEDKSFFPFDDRIDLANKGTADLPNVSIIESGQFIISTLTFTEYFNKKELQNMTIDSSLDVTLFAREIAPCIHISVRFAGSEPFDKVTKQYNDTLRVILPHYGIEFEEIPRIEFDGEVVSASRVRKLLENKDLETISKLVPKTTLKYLEEHYGWH